MGRGISKENLWAFRRNLIRSYRKQARITQEIIIPRSLWRRSDAYRQRTPEAVRALAKKIQINPIIIAGRIRHDAKNYLLLSQMVGKGEVRKLFLDIKWPGEK